MTAMKKSKGRPFDADGNITRARIIDAARECFATHGYGDATNKDIASAAGVSPSSIYNYFPAKKDIYFAIFEEGEDYISAAYQQMTTNATSPLDGLCKIFDANIAIHNDRPDLPPFFAHVRFDIERYPELAHYIAQRERKIQPIVRTLVDKAIESGEITNALPADSIEAMLFASIFGMSIFGLQVDKDDHQNTMKAFRALLDGSLTQ
jgi:AcrR family transcriptional regulator